MTDYPIGVKPNQVSKKPYSGQSHTPKSQKGMGDYYGTGITAKIGKIRDGSMGIQTLTPEEMKKPPRSLA
jgi:hypothetical protein